MFAGAASPSQAGRARTSARHAIGVADGEAQRDRRAHRDAADDEPADAAAVGKRQDVVGEIGDRECRRIAGLRPALPPAFQRQPADAGRSGNTSATCASSPPSPCWKTTGRPSPPSQTRSVGAVALECRTSSCCGRHRDGPLQETRRRRAPLLASAHASPAARRSRRRAGSRTKSPKSTTPWPAAAKLPSARAVLGMGHGDAVAEQVDRLGDRCDRAPSASPPRTDWPDRARCAAAARSDLVDQPPRGRGRGDDIGQFRLDAEIDAVALGERDRLAPSPPAGRARPRRWHCRDDAPTGRRGSRVPVQSVTSGVPMRGAAAMTTASRRKPVGAHRRDRDGSCCRCRRAPRSPTPDARPPRRSSSAVAGAIASGMDGRPSAGHVELRRRHSRRRARRCSTGRRRCRERSWRRCRAASDRPVDIGEPHRLAGCAPIRAIATMARTEAMPSSISAPRIGAPSRMASAKPSSWRR